MKKQLEITFGYKKFLCEKAGISTLNKTSLFDKNTPEYFTTAVLFMAMCAINREGEYLIYIKTCEVTILNEHNSPKHIFYKDHNNSEIETLKQALHYIYTEYKRRGEK